MFILTFEELNNKFNIDNNAMSDIRKKDLVKDISLTPIEIVMRDQTSDSFTNRNSNIIVNLHPTEGTHLVLVIRREGGPTYYFDSFGVETPPLFLEKYVDLGSNERIQQYDESYYGAYCLYMIYLFDRGFRIKSALNILVNQCIYPGIYKECFCLNCIRGDVKDNVNVNDNDNDNVNVNVNDNDNVNVSDNDNDNDSDNVVDKDNVIDNTIANVIENVNVSDNDNDDNFIYLFGEKHQRGKSNSNSNSNTISNGEIWTKSHSPTNNRTKSHSPTNNIREAVSPISVNINDDQYSWLTDDDIITEAAFPDNFRCIISGLSECGKTFLLKKLILASIYFDRLYIIGPTGDQYN